MRSPWILALALGGCSAPPRAMPQPEAPATAPTRARDEPPPAAPSPTAASVPPPVLVEQNPPPTKQTPTSIASAHWQTLGSPGDGPIAYSANGKWYALLTSEGLVLGDSSTWQPLSVVRLNIDKGSQALFHPSSEYIVAVYDFSLEIWSITEDASGVTMTVSDPPLPWQETPATNPLAFDASGTHLAVADSVGAVVYDFHGRKPIARLYPQFSLMPAAIGFSRDDLFLVQPSSGACECDDFGGSTAGVATWKIGGTRMTARPLQGDLGVEVSLRQGTLASGANLWDVRTGRRTVHHQLSASEAVVDVYRLRTTRRWVGMVLDSTRKPETHVGLFGGGGKHRELGPVSADIPLGLSVRPQDDLAVYVEHDYGTRRMRFHVLPIAGGGQRTTDLPERVCVDTTRVVPDSVCQGAPEAGPAYVRQPEAPGLDERVPVIQAPPLPPPNGPRPGTSFEGWRDGRELSR